MRIKELPHNHGHVSDELQMEILNTTTFSVISDLFKMMSDEKRVQIFLLLCHCEECVINISALLDMSSPAVSHHLKLLKTAGLVINRREGKEVYYTAANTSRSQSLHKLIEEMIEVNCPSDKTFQESVSYDTQVQIVNEIRSFLTKNLKNRYTIEDLAVKFHINQTTLKATFKRVFGKPIATYTKIDTKKRKQLSYLKNNYLRFSYLALLYHVYHWELSQRILCILTKHLLQMFYQKWNPYHQLCMNQTISIIGPIKKAVRIMQTENVL